jgi:hypothetical protein
VENLGLEEEHDDHDDDYDDKLMTLIVDASSLTLSKKKRDYILRRNGYVRKKSLSNCILPLTKNPKVISYKE